MLTHKGTQTIEAERLILRRFKLSDAGDMFANWANDSEVTRFLVWQPHGDIEVTKKTITKWVTEYESHSKYEWAIELKEIGQAIGSICATGISEPNYSCEIGYCMSRRYWNQGIMTEAVKSVTGFLFTEIGMNRISACHDTNNPASGRVMAKSGMTFEGVNRQARFDPNRGYYDIAVYAILKAEWNAECKL